MNLPNKQFCYLGVLGLLAFLPACASNQELLVGAAIHGDNETLRKLLQPGKADINAPFALTDEKDSRFCPGHKALTALQAAACANRAGAVEKLLAMKADIDAEDAQGATALSLAMDKGNTKIVRVLLEAGANPDTKDRMGFTSLMRAASSGDIESIRFLIGRKTNVSMRGPDGVTALTLASTPETAKALIAAGADFVTGSRGNTPLHYAALYRSAEMSEFLLSNGFAADKKNDDGMTAFDLAKQRAAGQDGRSASINSDRKQNIARARRGVPARGGEPQQVMEVRSQGDGPAVFDLLKKEMQRLIEADLAEAGRLADAGKFSDALAKYTAVINRAISVDAELEQKLRVGIVRYAASQSVPPDLSETAREHLVRSAYLLKNNKDQALVEQELMAVLRESPWWADGYYNLGVLQTERKKLDEAARNLKIFIAAAPSDPKAQAAQDKIYEIKLVKEEIGKVKGMAGSWVSSQGRSFSVSIGEGSVYASSGGLNFNMRLSGETLTGTVSGPSTAGAHGCTHPAQSHQVTGRFDTNARVIELEYSWANYESKYHCINMAGAPSNCCLLCSEVCDGSVITSTPTVNIHLTPAGR
jgi:tetratricopeptide (TPR) repeat protein